MVQEIKKIRDNLNVTNLDFSLIILMETVRGTSFEKKIAYIQEELLSYSQRLYFQEEETINFNRTRLVRETKTLCDEIILSFNMNSNKSLQDLLAQGQTEQVIKLLLEGTSTNGQSQLHDNLILLSVRNHRNQGEKDRMDSRDYSTECNKIEHSLSMYIKEYEDDGVLNNKINDILKAEKKDKKTKNNMQIVKIFLASSAELKEDRDQLRLFISVENDRYISKIFISS